MDAPRALLLLVLLVSLGACTRTGDEAAPVAPAVASASAPAAVVLPAPLPLWRPIKSVDRMTDETECVLQYRDMDGVWYNTKDGLVVSYDKRGHVQTYQYRFDAHKASWQFDASQAERRFLTFGLAGQRRLDAQRMLIRVKTQLGTTLEDEIDLRGLGEARASMFTLCGLAVPDPEEVARVAQKRGEEAAKRVDAMMRRYGVKPPAQQEWPAPPAELSPR